MNFWVRPHRILVVSPRYIDCCNSSTRIVLLCWVSMPSVTEGNNDPHFVLCSQWNLSGNMRLGKTMELGESMLWQVALREMPTILSVLVPPTPPATLPLWSQHYAGHHPVQPCFLSELLSECSSPWVTVGATRSGLWTTGSSGRYLWTGAPILSTFIRIGTRIIHTFP